MAFNSFFFLFLENAVETDDCLTFDLPKKVMIKGQRATILGNFAFLLPTLCYMCKSQYF